MQALAQPALGKLMMFLLALVAHPVDEGESFRVDRVGASGSVQSYEIAHTDDGYAISTDGDEVATIRVGDEDGTYQIVEGDDEKKVDLGELLGGIEPGELAEVDEKLVTIKGHSPVRLTRVEGLVYLTSAPVKSTVYVVRGE